MSDKKEKKTVRTTIDGTGYTFQEGTTILEAAKSVGIEIPHYCYHPGLSIAGNCRMCLVEIEGMPKLQISCYTPVAEGMVVHTSNARVKRARQAVLEFLLINHPLDCPVCDQAGECGLQIYYMEHGLYDSRLAENKVKKHKKAARIGPSVMLDQERCILCTRCVRFCEEVSQTRELGMFERGDHSEIDIYPGQELDNPYSGNVVDLCPVGALTDRDFRFKTRVWYLDQAESVCPGCARGCNIYIHYNLHRPYKNPGRRISRLKPRYNPEVNQWWMCDEGRYGFKFVDDDRLTEPSMQRKDALEPASWKQAVEAAAEGLQKAASSSSGDVTVLVSPWLSNEELHLLGRVFSEQVPGSRIAFSAATRFEPTEDNFLRLADKNPNTLGARLLGLAGNQEVMDLEELKLAALAGKISALYICHHDLPGLPGEQGSGWAEALDKCELVVFQGTNRPAAAEKAQIVLPAATFAEREGTVVNADSRIQIQRKVFAPLGLALPGWEIIRRLGQALGGEYPFKSADSIFADLARRHASFQGLDYEKIGAQGIRLEGR